MRPVPARQARDASASFLRPRQGAAERHGERDHAGDIGGRQFDRQQDEPIGRDIEQAAERVGEGLAKHGVRVDNDRAAAAARAQRRQLIENERRGEADRQRGGNRQSEREAPALRRLGADQQDRRGDECGYRECHAADKARAFETGDDDEDQYQQQRQALPLGETLTSSIAVTAHDAAIRCCGTQVA